MSKCKDTEHDYRLASERAYFKLSGKTTGLGLPDYDQSVSYSMLYCTKCGDTKEIISADHRKHNVTP